MTKSEAQAVLLTATGRSDLADAFAWLAGDYTLTGAKLDVVLQALATLNPETRDGKVALQLVARRQSRSELDSAAILFRPDTIAPASRFRAALECVRRHSPDGRLSNVNATAAIAAQRDDPFAITALCAIAGISYSDLTERVEGMPANPLGQWNNTSVRKAFRELDAIVRGLVPTSLPGAVPVGPIDLMPEFGAANTRPGWATVEAQFVGGVPYEVLLAQRVAGGTWLAHRNATSGTLNARVADRLCSELDERGVKYRRSTLVGGDIVPSAIMELAGSDKQVGLVILDLSGDPIGAVVFASARDSGTASKSAARLRNMTQDRAIPIYLVLTGRGWSVRNETAALATVFGGRLYSEMGLGDLVNRLSIQALKHR